MQIPDTWCRFDKSDVEPAHVWTTTLTCTVDQELN